GAFASFTKHRVYVSEAAALVPKLDRAVAMLTMGRPGPVLFEVPVDVLRAEHPAGGLPPLPPCAAPVAPRPQEVNRLAELLLGWRRPLILAGGGVTTAGADAQLVQLAERLGAPVFITAMGKCAIPSKHPLAAGLPWFKATSDLSNMEDCFSPLFREADGLLAV